MSRFKEQDSCFFVTIVLLIVVRVDGSCSGDPTIGYSMPCNQKMDPWIVTRDTLDVLSAGSEAACGRKLPDEPVRPENDLGGCKNDQEEEEDDTWSRIVDGTETVLTVKDTVDSVKETIGEMKESFKKMKAIGKEINDVGDTAADIAETAAATVKKLKGAKKYLKKGLKLLGTLASALQFVGPVMDIVMMFMPAGKSEELKAIESGFAKMGARMDALSSKLDTISGAVEWNSILDDLMKFESKVDHLMKKYEQLFVDLKGLDNSQAMPINTRSMIEDLVNQIGDGGNLGSNLNNVAMLFEGESQLNDGKTLLEIYLSAVGNDCSKIVPISNSIIKIVISAQKLVHFYEVNQQLCLPEDDRGYPKMVYDMYVTSTQQFIECTNKAQDYAREEMKIRLGDGDELGDIIDELEQKYSVYNWATMKENNKEKDKILMRDYTASTDEVELSDISDDDKKDERLTLFSVTKSTKDQIKYAANKIFTIAKWRNEEIKNCSRNITSYARSRYSSRTGCNSLKYISRSLSQILDTTVEMMSTKDEDLKSLFEQNRITVVMFKEKAGIDLTGWHYKINMKVLSRELISYSYMSLMPETYTLGFLFSFEDTTVFKCEHGTKYFISSDSTLPYCLCQMGYGGDACDISLQKPSTENEEILGIVQYYKVPGMFDINDRINEQTDEIMNQLEQNKQEVFREAQDTRKGIQESKNAILSAQSMMLNEVKADNDKFMKEFTGLKVAMDAAFERERNERIYQTDKGNKVVVSAISKANDEVKTQMGNLKGTIVQNRYFEALTISVPMFEKQFAEANSYQGKNAVYKDIAMKAFVGYIEENEAKFDGAKRSVERAILEEKDSFIAATMEENMVLGCTDEYTKEIKSSWQELFQLHLSLTTIEGTVAAYKIAKSTDPHTKAYLQSKLETLNTEISGVTDNFKRVYNERSCPEFSMPDLKGGGCKASTTYPGQQIPVICWDSGKSLVVASTGKPISNINCGYDSKWSVDLTEFKCLQKCQYKEKTYAVGETRMLPTPKKGFQWEKGSSKATCIASFDVTRPISSTRAYWDVTKQLDIDECSNESFCGKGANSCTNTIGSFNCSCKPGFHSGGDTGKCTDKDECAYGEIGYKRCLVQQNLGTCRNEAGKYRCSCLVGSYRSSQLPGQECKACQCKQSGVTTKVCDAVTGNCLCKPNVGGWTCAKCKDRYTNYPYCNKCAAGYYNFPECRKCDCEVAGVSPQVCDPNTGSCECRSAGVAGPKCKTCKADYKNYPVCEEDVRDGTLSDWGAWSKWDDKGTCGPANVRKYLQERTRRRTCNDNTLNRFGKSCEHRVLVDKQTRDNDVCRTIQYVYIRLWDSNNAPTSGKVWAQIEQNEDAKCETDKPTWDKPGDKKRPMYKLASQYSCFKTFDITKTIRMNVHSDSSNDMYLQRFGVILTGGIKKEFEWKNSLKKVEKNKPSLYQYLVDSTP